MGVQKYPYLARDLRNTGWLFGYIVEHGLSFVKAARKIVDVFFNAEESARNLSFFEWLYTLLLWVI